MTKMEFYVIIKLDSATDLHLREGEPVYEAKTNEKETYRPDERQGLLKNLPCPCSGRVFLGKEGGNRDAG